MAISSDPSRSLDERVSALMDNVVRAESEYAAYDMLRGASVRELHALADLLYLDTVSDRDALARVIAVEARA